MTVSNLLQNQLNYWNQIIKSESSNPKAYIQRGMTNFKLGNIAASIQDFDRAESLDSRLTPYLWQRGLSYYYAGQFEQGVRQFEIDLTVNAQDVEETVWRYLCQAQFLGVEQAGKLLLLVRNDPRPVMALVYDLYAGNCSVDELLAVGKKHGKGGYFYSHLYTGLYFEASKNIAQAQDYLLKAATCQLDDYMWYLSRVHLLLRGWS